MPQSWQSRCTECEGFAREFQDAWQSDQQEIRAHFQATAEATGRQPQTFLQQWIISLGQMPDDEFESLQWARYLRAAAVQRKWKEHAADSGHSGLADGWRGAFIFDSVLRSGYGGFLKGSGDPNQ